ncbi:MAG TPA: hypothetical protein DHW78_06535 [Ruminococcaceae bacterium]|jgi:hypothetical protein|nr:hypothetical protein [Oscillospiraceae bacterium]HCC01207.1 hypothetical protein [Oscillospiraceae bacterium]HCM23960.1 hypothetical protein [Oscillospiraceae bacterium]
MLQFETTDKRKPATSQIPETSTAQQKQKLAVLFPGTGYGCDRPLLYYARRAAEQEGCDVLPLTYTVSLERNPAKMTENVQQALPSVLHTVLAAVGTALCRGRYTQIFFFSKSFGTIVAGELAQKLPKQDIRQFFLTPLEPTLPYMQKHSCFAASGTADPWVPQQVREKILSLPGVRMSLFPGANHSLEVPGNVAASVRNLQMLIDSYVAFLCEK